MKTCALCGWRLLNHFDVVSETPYSCGTVGCELQRVILCSLLCPEMGWKICVGKQGYSCVCLFQLISYSDVLMFHFDINLCNQLF